MKKILLVHCKETKSCNFCRISWNITSGISKIFNYSFLFSCVFSTFCMFVVVFISISYVKVIVFIFLPVINLKACLNWKLSRRKRKKWKFVPVVKMLSTFPRCQNTSMSEMVMNTITKMRKVLQIQQKKNCDSTQNCIIRLHWQSV